MAAISITAPAAASSCMNRSTGCTNARGTKRWESRHEVRSEGAPEETTRFQESFAYGSRSTCCGGQFTDASHRAGRPQTRQKSVMRTCMRRNERTTNAKPRPARLGANRRSRDAAPAPTRSSGALRPSRRNDASSARGQDPGHVPVGRRGRRAHPRGGEAMRRPLKLALGRDGCRHRAAPARRPASPRPRTPLTSTRVNQAVNVDAGVAEPAVGRHRRRARHLHAGRLRPRRDRLLPGQARGTRGQHELRHLRARLRRLLRRAASPSRSRNFSFAAIGLTDCAGARTDGLIGSGQLGVPVGQGRLLPLGHQPGPAPAAAAFFLYMVAFMDTTATIPTGSMAERWKWKSFVVWGLFCGAIYYPLFAGFTWGGGWLAKLGESASLGFGYVDFAGSGVVHAMGGIAALAGAIVLGPRIGKFGKDGKPRALPGPPHPDGHARHVHPAVRLVRLQRRLDASPPPTSSSPRLRRTPRSRRRSEPPSGCSGSCCGPASPIPA